MNLLIAGAALLIGYLVFHAVHDSPSSSIAALPLENLPQGNPSLTNFLVSTGEASGLSTDTLTPFLQSVAKGIARGEGFYVANSRPARNHNPGDLMGDYGWGTDGANYALFPSDDVGFNACVRDLRRKWTGNTKTSFSLGMSWTAFGELWTADKPDTLILANWVACVTRQVGDDFSIDISTTDSIASTMAKAGVTGV